MATWGKKNHGRSNGSNFVQIHNYEIDCPAYRSLTHVARALYVEFKRRFNGCNNGDIHFSVRDMALALNVGNQGTAVKAQHELQRKGFIKVAHLASFDTRKNRKATTWILTVESLNGISPTKEFMRWNSEANDFPVKAGKSIPRKNTASHNEASRLQNS